MMMMMIVVIHDIVDSLGYLGGNETCTFRLLKTMHRSFLLSPPSPGPERAVSGGDTRDERCMVFSSPNMVHIL